MLNHNITLETLYNCLFVSHHSVMLLIDPETGEIIDANQAACQFYQFDKEDLLKLKISDINVLSKEEVKLEMAKAALEKRNHFYFRHRIKTGEIRDVEVYSTPIELEGRVYLFSIITDVTQHMDMIRKQAKALKEAQDAQAEIEELRDVVPVCSYCKKIRNDTGHWETLETYLEKFIGAPVSHGICPECFDTEKAKIGKN